MAYGLRTTDPTSLNATKSGRVLATIRRDMDLKDGVMRKRLRNEEVLSLAYRDGTMLGGGDDADNLREYALNLPYRYVRWLESQATSKKMVVKVNRDAGEGQHPGGPADNATGMWQGITLCRVAYEAGFKREIRAVIGEVCPRGTSVIRIGYHAPAITAADSAEVGKDAQSVVGDVLGKGDVEAKEGQAHGEVSTGLGAMAADPMVQATVGREGVGAILARKDSHDQAEYARETKTAALPTEDVRPTRHRIWMRKLRVGEDCGWSPNVYDVEDAGMWWARHVDTVAWVKSSSLFSDSFKKMVKGYDARNVSGVARGGETPSTQSMSPDARAAQSEDVLDDDERLVEWFEVWCRRPEMLSGGVRKIVSPECPTEFVEADEANPHVFPEGTPDAGRGSIPGFYPFYDFTPILSSLTVPERTTGIPLIAAGMTQFEQICEILRLLHESSLRHSLRLYEIHPALKDDKLLLDALRNGEDGYAYVGKEAQRDATGKWVQGVTPIQFSGNTLDLERMLALLESSWVKSMGMPPAVLQGVGTAGTLGQDNMGLAAGERESGALVAYFEERVADVLSGVRGLLRANYDDEDFVRLLGTEGAEVMKAWQTGATDDGDAIEVTFGVNAQAQETVEKKQLMEAITLEKGEIEPVTGLEKFDTAPLFEELHRRLDVGKPKLNDGMMQQLQQLALIGKQVLMAQQATQTGASGGGAPGRPGTSSSAGPNPSEGDGPKEGNLAAGATRGTLAPTSG